MFAPFALRFPFEMLHGIGDVNFIAGHAGLRERLVEDLPRRSHERMARSILLIPWLLTDEQDLRVRRSFAEDRLSGSLVEIAAGAGFSGCAQSRNR
jgi:hypothetical protein